MDGHWEWSGSGDEPDTGDTAELGGDSGFGGHDPLGHDDFGGHDGLSGEPDGDAHGGHGEVGADDLEEPLGTEHAAETYDQSVHTGHGDTDGGYGHTDGEQSGDPEHGAEYEPAGEHTGIDTADSTGPADHVDTGVDEDGVQHTDTFGSDPDLAGGEDGWHEPVFPEHLDLDGPPEPVDGFPWSDADVLGGPDHTLSAAYDPSVHTGDAGPADLAGYAGVDLPPGIDPWSLLLGSDDPATSSLAGYWAPQA